MRSKLAAALLVTMLAVQCSLGTQSSNSNDPVFFLHINQPVDPAFVTISYQVKGEKSDDGYINFGHGGPYLDYDTDTRHPDQPDASPERSPCHGPQSRRVLN